MKRSKLFGILSVGILSIGTVVAPLAMPSSAQVGEPADPGVDRVVTDRDGGFDWGWLGLLGLIGLAGLGGKKSSDRHEPTAYREPDVTSRSSYRE